MVEDFDRSDGLLRLGDRYKKQGNLEKAVECYRKALELYPRPNSEHYKTILGRLGAPQRLDRDGPEAESAKPERESPAAAPEVRASAPYPIVLGHFKHTSLGGGEYNLAPVTLARPYAGVSTQTIRCPVCNKPLKIKVASRRHCTQRRVKRLVLALALWAVSLWLFGITTSMEPGPDRRTVGSLVFVVGVAALAFLISTFASDFHLAVDFLFPLDEMHEAPRTHVVYPPGRSVSDLPI